jgi:hypothetical protein
LICSNITAVAAFVADNFLPEDHVWLPCVQNDWSNASFLENQVLPNNAPDHLTPLSLFISLK